jgi:hypothetical protein
MSDQIDFDALLDFLAEHAGRAVRVEVGIREGMDPLTDYPPAVLCGQLGSIGLGEDIGHGRIVASLPIGADRSRIRLDKARFRWGKVHGTTVKANFDGLLITIAS